MLFRSSNLGDVDPKAYVAASARATFEEALGEPVQGELDLYAMREKASIRKTLGLLRARLN